MVNAQVHARIMMRLRTDPFYFPLNEGFERMKMGRHADLAREAPEIYTMQFKTSELKLPRDMKQKDPWADLGWSRQDESGLVEAFPASRTIRVTAPCFFREMYSACQDLFDDPEMIYHPVPITAIGASQDNAFWKWEAINGWAFEGLDQVDFRYYIDKEQPPQPHLTRARITYESEDGSEQYEHGDEMVNLIPGIPPRIQPSHFTRGSRIQNCHITYIEEDGTILKQPFESKSEMADHDFYDENEGIYYYLPDPGNTDDRRLVHSFDDKVALYENEYKRSHWIWKGILHRLTGPAFNCVHPGPGEEYHAFGFWLDAEVDSPKVFLSDNKEYLHKLQEYLEDHNILPVEFDGIWSLQNFDNFLVSLGRKTFRWTADGKEINLFDEVPGFEEDEGVSGLGAALGIAALSAVAVATLKSKARSKETQQVKREQVQEV